MENNVALRTVTQVELVESESNSHLWRVALVDCLNMDGIDWRYFGLELELPQGLQVKARVTRNPDLVKLAKNEVFVMSSGESISGLRVPSEAILVVRRREDDYKPTPYGNLVPKPASAGNPPYFEAESESLYFPTTENLGCNDWKMKFAAHDVHGTPFEVTAVGRRCFSSFTQSYVLFAPHVNWPAGIPYDDTVLQDQLFTPGYTYAKPCPC